MALRLRRGASSTARPTVGVLEVISGPMFSGKTEALIEQLEQAARAGAATIAVKPEVDTRIPATALVAHGGRSWPAVAVASSRDIADVIGGDADVVGIDEAQFFDEDLVGVAKDLVKAGIRVVVAGLDRDFRKKPFGPIPHLMTIADEHAVLTAKCAVCGAPAELTQRLIDGKPAPPESPTIMIGSSDLYEPRCTHCYI